MKKLGRIRRDRLTCDAGRRADFGGRWRTPCQYVFGRDDRINMLGFEGTDVIGGPLRFCDAHFQQLIDAGLITEPNIGADEFERRQGRP